MEEFIYKQLDYLNSNSVITRCSCTFNGIDIMFEKHESGRWMYGIVGQDC